MALKLTVETLVFFYFNFYDIPAQLKLVTLSEKQLGRQIACTCLPHPSLKR